MKPTSIYKSTYGESVVMRLYTSLLAEWPVPYVPHNILTRHGHTFVIESGNRQAPPLILLHGAGTNSCMWAGDVAEYIRHYRVFAVDLPGEPGKSTAKRLDWEGSAFVEWLEDVQNGLQIERASMVGFSQGGWTALKFAVSRPERVGKMVLLSPGGIAPDKIFFVIRTILLSMLGSWGFQRINRLLYGNQVVTPEVEDALTLIMTHYKARLEPLPIFTDEQLQQLTMPVLVLMGDKDALRDAKKIIPRLKKKVPNLKTGIIAGGGHALFKTTAEILPFLEYKGKVWHS